MGSRWRGRGSGIGKLLRWDVGAGDGAGAKYGLGCGGGSAFDVFGGLKADPFALLRDEKIGFPDGFGLCALRDSRSRVPHTSRLYRDVWVFARARTALKLLAPFRISTGLTSLPHIANARCTGHPVFRTAYMRKWRARVRKDWWILRSCLEDQATTRSTEAAASCIGMKTTSSEPRTCEPLGRRAMPSPDSTRAMTPEETDAVATMLGEKPASSQRAMTLSKTAGEFWRSLRMKRSPRSSLTEMLSRSASGWAFGRTREKRSV